MQPFAQAPFVHRSLSWPYPMIVICHLFFFFSLQFAQSSLSEFFHQHVLYHTIVIFCILVNIFPFFLQFLTHTCVLVTGGLFVPWTGYLAASFTMLHASHKISFWVSVLASLVLLQHEPCQHGLLIRIYDARVTKTCDLTWKLLAKHM